MDFIYKEEYWYVSSFLNSKLVNGDLQSEVIEKKTRERINSLSKEDIYYKIRDEISDEIIDMARNVSLSCKWVPILSASKK